jgi:hypothetical protein
MTVAPTPIQSPREHHLFRWMLVVLLACLAGLAVGLLFQFDVFGGSSSPSVEGSGVAATQARDVAPFSSVDLARSNNVVLRVGGKQSVVVRGDDNLLDRVTTDVQKGTLVIGNTPGDLTTNSPMSVMVSVPSLTALSLSGSGNIAVSGIKTETLTVSLRGSGNLTGRGTASRLDVTVGGSGNAFFERLVANDVKAMVSGSGTIFVTATRSLDGSVPGSGVIVYAGNPQDVTKSVSGMGAITGR